MPPRRIRSLALGLLLSASAAGAGPAPFEPADAAGVLREVRAPGAAVTLVSVWATWCLPCREEFPDLLRLQRTYADAGLRLVLVNADFGDARDEARAFLRQQGVSFPSFYKAGDDGAFIDALGGGWSGALPATFLYDGTGALREAWESKSTYQALERKIRPYLAPAGEAKAKETTR
jgi:thiol-disulfide isomerase/thioredoxin